MTQRFKNALDALVYAFFNDTLAKGDCACCAVGNIVAHAHGRKIDMESSIKSVLIGETRFGLPIANSDCRSSFCTFRGFQTVREELFHDEQVTFCFSKTGYAPIDMAKVEFAFETASQITIDDYPKFPKEAIMQDQYNGLMAVLDVLCEIEGIEDPAEYKELFALPQ